MLQFTKILHVYAMGLWFGMALFFTFPVTLSLFGTFNELGDLPAKQRPAWFPVADAFSHTHKDALGPGKDLIGPREQGSRAFAVAVSPLFTWYFLLSGICGLVAVLTALTWSRKFPQFRVHQLRASILFAALITVLIGWPLERKVSELREPRNQATLAYLDSESPTEAQHKEMMEARAEFGMWHTLSLFLNFATVLLVVVGMAMTTDLPTANEASNGRAGMATPPAADRNFGTLKP